MTILQLKKTMLQNLDFNLKQIIYYFIMEHRLLTLYYLFFFSTHSPLLNSYLSEISPSINTPLKYFMMTNKLALSLNCQERVMPEYFWYNFKYSLITNELINWIRPIKNECLCYTDKHNQLYFPYMKEKPYRN